MLFKTTALTLLAATASAKLTVRSPLPAGTAAGIARDTSTSPAPLLSRQVGEFQIPENCESRCEGLVDIYNDCASGNEQECLRICEQDEYETFVGCAQCEIDEGGYTYSESDARLLEQAMRQFTSLCSRVGRRVEYVALNITTSDNPTMPSGGPGQSAIPAPSNSPNAAIAHVGPGSVHNGLVGAAVALAGVVGGAVLLA